MVVFAVGGAGDRRRRVGEFLLCSDTWELLYIMRDDLSLYSRGIVLYRRGIRIRKCIFLTTKTPNHFFFKILFT